MTKRKSLFATFAFVLALSLALIFGISLLGGTLTAQAASAPSYVTVNGKLLYSGYYLESNDSTTYSTGATTEPTTYVAWYDGATLTLNGYNGGQITFGGASAVDLTIKLKGENTITASSQGISSEECENLVIDADNEATLNINVSSSTETVFGICIGYSGVATTGTVTIKGKSTVNINSKTSVGDACGIHAKTGFNIVGSANLSVKNTSSHSTSVRSFSIASFNNKPLFNTDGVVTLDNSECANRNYCIGAYGIDMEKGTLICRYKPETIYSYACSQTISTAPEGCVLRENPYGLGETVITYGVGHTVTVENGLDYYEKKSNQYVAGETVKVKTTIADLPFKGWEGTGVTFVDATQKETSFVMVNEDVTIKAVYDVFAKQPVFKTTAEKKGSLSVQLNKQISDGRSIVLINSSDEENSTLYFSQDAVSENYTYKCSDVWESSVPAGTYRIRVNYNGYYFYSDTFEVNYPFANVSDAKVEGKRGREITPVSFDVTLTYATFKAIPEGTDVSSWFEYIPKGLVAKINAVSEGATSATITISGTPTEIANRAIYLNIPKEYLATGNDIVITTKYNSGASFNIVNAVSYSITVKDGVSRVDGTFQSSAQEGTIVTIKANDKAGYVFDKWVVVSGGVSLTDENNKETTFVMPESNVEIKATYKAIPKYTVTIIDGKLADNTTNGSFKEGESLTITADTKAGFIFDKWTATGITLTSEQLTSQTITITVGTNDITLTATYKAIVSSIEAFVTAPVKDNTADTTSMRVNGTGYSATNVEWYKGEGVVSSMLMGTTDKFIAGQSYTVVVTLTVNSGYVFAGSSSLAKSINGQAATLNSGSGTDTITIKTTFDVPTEPIPEHSVTVENGTLESGATTGNFAEGSSVTVSANAPASDMMFDKWTVSGITLSSDQRSSQTLTFTMGTNDVTLTATYKAIPKYTVTVENGKLADGTTSGSFKAGESVTITADAKEGYTFDKWTATGITLTSEQLSSSTITITVGTNDITLTATYTEVVAPTPKHNVTIENGTNSGGEEIEVGQTVTITAGEAPEGKEFDKWVVVSGEVELANANNVTTTFVMPDGNVEIKATYKDKTPSGGEDTPGGEIKPTPDDEGLSGGAIAGIVIACVVVVGIGVFAVIWFAVKKKTFADLGVAIKAIFKKNK